MTAKVEVYGTTNGRKCTDVRDLLDNKNIEYEDHRIDLMAHTKDDMFRRTGLKYYPQIFINDEHIGGEEELMMLEFEGKLDPLLNL